MRFDVSEGVGFGWAVPCLAVAEVWDPEVVEGELEGAVVCCSGTCDIGIKGLVWSCV